MGNENEKHTNYDETTNDLSKYTDNNKSPPAFYSNQGNDIKATMANLGTLNVVAGSLNKDIRKIYKFKEVLGGGHFGSVRIAYKRDEEPRKYYAAKSISKKNLTAKDLEDLIREVEILSTLNHPNIIKFYETYHDKYYFHIVMELCSGKEIFEKIVSDGKISEKMVSQIITKVLHAISYCHSKGITHRDLKPENILFSSPSPNAEIKLVDFGLSRKYQTNEKMHTILGTPYYIAPEVLQGEYDEKCDVWSIGAMTYIMLCGEPPFNAETNNEIFTKIVKDELKFTSDNWKHISNDAKDFIMKCMTKKSENRLSASNALNHPWFKNILKEVHKEEYFATDILLNLRNFSSPEKFKKIVLKFFVNNISQREMNKLTKAFFAIDLDHSGQIDVNDLTKAFKMANINISEDELQKIIQSSEEGVLDGRIDYNEFLMACMNQKKNIGKEKLIQAFKYFDIDDSGYIDAGDLKNALLRSGKQVVNPKEIDEIIQEINAKDKKISLEQFLQLFDLK